MLIILLIFSEIFLVTAMVLKKPNLLEVLSSTALILLGTFGFISFVLNEFLFINYHTSPIYLAISFGAVFLLTYLYKKREGGFNIIKRLRFENTTKGEIVFVLISLLLVIRGAFVPVRGWDAYSMYDGRGRYYAAGDKQSMFAEFSIYDESNNLYYFSYPPMTSSIHAVIYSLSNISPTFIYPMFYFVLIATVYLFLKSTKLSPKFIWLILVVIAFNKLIFSQIFSSYTNLPMMAFQISSFYLASRYLTTKKLFYILVSGLFLGFSNWTRSLEPTYISFLLFAVFTIFWNRNLKVLGGILLSVVYLFISLGPRMIWSSYVLSTVGTMGAAYPSLPNLLSILSGSLFLSNILDVLFFIYVSLSPIKPYITFYVVLLAIMLFIQPKLSKNIMSYVIVLLILSILVMMFVGTLYFSKVFSWWNEIQGSFLRSNVLLIPLTIILSGYMLEGLRSKK